MHNRGRVADLNFDAEVWFGGLKQVYSSIDRQGCYELNFKIHASPYHQILIVVLSDVHSRR